VNGITELQIPYLIESQVFPDYGIAEIAPNAKFSSGFSGKRERLLVRSVIFT
jgi:hypothetical protein